MKIFDFKPKVLSKEYVKEHGTLYDEYIFYSEDEECEPLYDKSPALGGKPFTGLLYELDIEGNLRYYQYYKDGFGDGEYIFEVVEPFDVQSGYIAPWFDQPGGGIQYKMNMTIEELLKAGKIRRIN